MVSFAWFCKTSYAKANRSYQIHFKEKCTTCTSVATTEQPVYSLDLNLIENIWSALKVYECGQFTNRKTC